jgi:hypothetical protein
MNSLIKSESGIFHRKERGAPASGGRIPVDEVLKEIMDNLMQERSKFCPLFSHKVGTCGLDELMEAIGECYEPDEQEEIRSLFVKVVPFAKVRKLVYACGDGISCDGMRRDKV